MSFFQTKPEATAQYDKIIAAFEEENPDINVVQNQVSQPETALRALLVKNRTPDVIALNPNGNMGKMAQSGVFYDFSDDDLVAELKPAMQQVLADLGTNGDQTNMLAYAGNVDGILYNVDIFRRYNIDVPQTWSELEEVVSRLEANGVAPFIGTLGDAGRVSTPLDGLAPYYTKDGFWDKMRAEGENVGATSEVSFQKNFKPLLDRLYWIYQHTLDGVRTMMYEDGNAAFAKGEGAMLLSGNWALAPIREINPDIQAAFFPYPTDNAEDAILVSGGDIAITMPANPKHEEASLKFVHYLFRKDVQDEFITSLGLVPSRTDAVIGDDLALQSAEPWIDSGRIEGYADHQIPTSISYNSLFNQAMLNGDIDGTLATMDNEWRKVAARTIE